MIGSAAAPASSGNLGPGFDSLALAIDLWCHCEAEPSDRWWIEEQGNGNRGSTSDLVVRAAQLAVGGMPMTLRIRNHIPRARGLGSSAAVTAAVAVAALRAVGTEPNDRSLFEIVAGLEGHPDNAAATVYGGLQIAYDGVVRRLPLAPELRVVLAVPHRRLSTERARAVLPGAVPHQAAARSVARMGMLLEGLRTGDADLLDKASGDELHELPRRGLSPLTARLIEAARAAGALHAAWSGAGPTVIAFATDSGAAGVEGALAAVLGDDGITLNPDVAHRGWS